MTTKKTTTTPQGSISYTDVGSGPPILMIHGLFASGRTFEEIVDLLTPDARCICPDLPGCGHSAAAPDFHPSWHSYAGFVKSFAQAINLDTFNLLGHSMGGGISTIVAAENPRKVEKLILVDPVVLPFKTPLKGRLPLVPLFGELLFRLYGEKMFLDYFRNDVFLHGEKMNEDKVKELYRFFAKDKGRALAALRATTDPRIPAGHVSSIECETMLLWGEEDALVPPSLSNELERIIGKTTVAKIPDCGHSPTEERPRATEQQIRGFLALAM